MRAASPAPLRAQSQFVTEFGDIWARLKGDGLIPVHPVSADTTGEKGGRSRLGNGDVYRTHPRIRHGAQFQELAIPGHDRDMHFRHALNSRETAKQRWGYTGGCHRLRDNLLNVRLTQADPAPFYRQTAPGIPFRPRMTVIPVSKTI